MFLFEKIYPKRLMLKMLSENYISVIVMLFGQRDCLKSVLVTCYTGIILISNFSSQNLV